MSKRNDIIIMKCNIADNIPGYIKKAVFSEEVIEHLEEGWEFASESDEMFWNQLQEEKSDD